MKRSTFSTVIGKKLKMSLDTQKKSEIALLIISRELKFVSWSPLNQVRRTVCVSIHWNCSWVVYKSFLISYFYSQILYLFSFRLPRRTQFCFYSSFVFIHIYRWYCFKFQLKGILITYHIFHYFVHETIIRRACVTILILFKFNHL